MIEQAFNPTVRRLQALRVPTVAAVNGVAAGAGASLAMTCDLAVAAPGASFIQAFSKIGLVPDAGGTWFLVKRLGLARAMGCAMLGDKLSAKDAKEQGMIWDVAAEGEDCVEAAMKLAQRLAAMPTRALVATRKLLRAAASSDLDAQLDAERDAQSAMGRTHDYIEGVTAFLREAPAAVQGRVMDRDAQRPGRPGRRSHVRGRPRQQGVHADGAGLLRAGPRRDAHDGARGHAQWPRHLPWRPDLHAGGLHLCLRLQQPQQGRPWRPAAASSSSSPAGWATCSPARAMEQLLQGRHGIYDMKVTNQRGEVVAMFRGKSAQIQGTVITEDAQ